MSKQISVERVKEIIIDEFQKRSNISTSFKVKDFLDSSSEAIDNEPASECQRCKEAEKYNMTTSKFLHFLKELEKNFDRTPTYHELIEKNKELEEKCQSCDQQYNNGFQDGLTKARQDMGECQRCKDLDYERNQWKELALTKEEVQKVQDIKLQKAKDRIKELEGLLREADREVEYISIEDDLFTDNYRKSAKELHDKIKQALGDV